MKGHPDAQKLIDYLSGKLSENESDRIEQHLSNCPVCRIALSSVEDRVENRIPREAESREAQVYRRMRRFMFGGRDE